MRTTPSPTDPSNGAPGDVGRAGGHAEGPSPGQAFRISHRGACSARLGPAEPWCFCVAFPCVGFGKWFVPEGVCGDPKCLCMMIPSAWGFFQPGWGARSGGFGARDLAAGRFHLGARCPVARQLPGATLCPLFPFSGMPLPTKASSAPKKSLFLAHLLDEARVPPSSSTLLPPRWEALAGHQGPPVCSTGSCRMARGCGCAPHPTGTPAEVCLSPRAQDHRVRQRLPADHPGEGSQHRRLQVRRPWAEGESSGAQGHSAPGR